MIDRVDKETRSRIMSSVHSENTAPEKAVRSLLHRMGYRFRLHRRDLPGTPDIVFPGRRAAIFVHGCFWHGHGCNIGKLPKSRVEYWHAKIVVNQERDRRKQAALGACGWRFTVVWQCELKDSMVLEAKLRTFLEES